MNTQNLGLSNCLINSSSSLGCTGGLETYCHWSVEREVLGHHIFSIVIKNQHTGIPGKPTSAPSPQHMFQGVDADYSSNEVK